MAVVETLRGIEARIGQSALEFSELIWPLIEPKFGPGRLEAVEGPDRERVARVVDQCFGIDYFFIPTVGVPFGIGQRVSTTDISGTPWDNFTMSAATYAQWREHVGKVGFLLPAILVQSFVTRFTNSTHVDSVGVVRAADLLRYAKEHPRQPRRKTDGRSAFYAWTFDELALAGIDVDRFPSRSLRLPFD